MSIDITPKARREPLKITYGEFECELSARIPNELVLAQDAVPRPKVMAGSQKTEYQNQVGITVIAAFLEYVVPADFREVLDFNDVPQVFQAWQEHTGWGKAPSSGN